MKRYISTSLLTVLLAIACRDANGGFHRDCHDEQLQKVEKQLSTMTDAERAQHPELAREAAQSREIIEKGMKLDDDLNRAWKSFSEQNAEALARDSAVQQARQQLEDIAKNIDLTNPDSVRRYEKQRDNYKEMVQMKAYRAGLSEPAIDNANSAVDKYQRYADVKEAGFLEKRLIAGPAESESTKIVDQVIKTAVVTLPISTENQALIRSHGLALSQAKAADALAAYAVADSISRQGLLPENLERAVKQAMVPFDTAAKVLPMVSGDALVGRMGLTHLGEMGGNAEAVDARKSLGPKTREQVAATAATVLIKLNHVEDFAATFRQNIRKEIVVPSPSIPAPKDPPSAKTLLTGVTNALKKTFDEQAGKLPTFVLP